MSMTANYREKYSHLVIISFFPFIVKTALDSYSPNCLIYSISLSICMDKAFANTVAQTQIVAVLI